MTLRWANGVESRQLAAQGDDQDCDDWPFVVRLLEEMVEADPGQSVGLLLLHHFQLRQRLVCVAPQLSQR